MFYLVFSEEEKRAFLFHLFYAWLSYFCYEHLGAKLVQAKILVNVLGARLEME